MNWRRIRRIIATLLLMTAICLVGLSWFIGGQLVAPANRTVGPPPADLSATATTLDSESGSQIATWYIPARNVDTKATVILLHGVRGDRRSMLGHARLLHEAGYTVVLIDLQAHGESPGEHITVGWLESHDVRAAVNFARRQNPDHRIGIIGRSLGGAATLLASPIEMDALVLEAVYPTITEAVQNRVAMRAGVASRILTPALLCQLRPRLGISVDDLRPIDHIDTFDCPVLIAAGKKDLHTTLSETERLFAAANPSKQLVVFPNAAHVDLLKHNETLYRDEILKFLDAHLQTDDRRSDESSVE